MDNSRRLVDRERFGYPCVIADRIYSNRHHEEFGTRMTFVGKRVLVVEDEFLVSLTTIDFLENIGCEVIGPAASLVAAIQLAHTESLDAAVLDINIASEMIWPVAEELQRRNVPFLFLSAYPERNVIPAHFSAVPRLGKPLEQNHLQRHLHAIWGAVCD